MKLAGLSITNTATIKKLIQHIDKFFHATLLVSHNARPIRNADKVEGYTKDVKLATERIGFIAFTGVYVQPRSSKIAPIAELRTLHPAAVSTAG